MPRPWTRGQDSERSVSSSPVPGSSPAWRLPTHVKPRARIPRGGGRARASPTRHSIVHRDGQNRGPRSERGVHRFFRPDGPEVGAGVDEHHHPGPRSQAASARVTNGFARPANGTGRLSGASRVPPPRRPFRVGWYAGSCPARRSRRARRPGVNSGKLEPRGGIIQRQARPAPEVASTTWH